jgi:hypothetical protein
MILRGKSRAGGDFVRRIVGALTLSIATLAVAAGCGPQAATWSDAASTGSPTPSGGPTSVVIADNGVAAMGQGGGSAGLGSAGVDPTPSGSASAGASTSAANAAVTPFPAGAAEVVRTAVPADSYPALVRGAIAATYRPVWVDGYDVAGQTYLNTVFRPNSQSTPWYEYVGMDATGYQSRFNTLKAAGYRLTFVESYLVGGQARYAAMWEKSSGPDYYAFHSVAASAYQSMLNTKTAAGYLPAQVSAISVNGSLFYTGLLIKRSLGKSWVLKSTLTPTDYQTLFTTETKAGLGLAYVNAYTVNGAAKFVALFASSASTSLQAKHGLTASALATQLSTQVKAGYHTRAVAGYDVSGSPRFIAYWTK